MSTRIPHGYRVSAASAADLLSFVAGLGERLLPVYEDLYLGAAARLAAFALDDLVQGTPPEDEFASDLLAHRSPVRYAARVLSAAHDQVRSSGRRDPLLDLELEVTFLSDPSSGDVFALLFCESSVLTGAWEALPEVSPWPYWNDTDPPSDVTLEEWDLRRLTWDRVVASSPPARRGLSWSLLGPSHSVRPSAHLSRLVRLAPSPLERAERLALRAVPAPTTFDLEAFRACREAAAALAPSLLPSLPVLDEGLLSRVP